MNPDPKCLRRYDSNDDVLGTSLPRQGNIECLPSNRLGRFASQHLSVNKNTHRVEDPLHFHGLEKARTKSLLGLFTVDTGMHSMAPAELHVQRVSHLGFFTSKWSTDEGETPNELA